MTDVELLKALGLTKESPLSEQIVQTTHHWMKACEENADLEEENEELRKENESLENIKNIQIGDLLKAKKIILSLYNAGRDVLMCRSEELAYERLDNAINDKRIEQFLKEIKEND